MTVRWERFAGRTDRFAIRVSLMTDPDEGAGALPEDAASWGSFQIWVDEKNLCAHVDQNEILSAVHWYLLPLVEWLAENWNAILHEERLPNVNSADTGAAGLSATRLAPALTGELDILAWDQEWFDWRARHALRSARAGGLFPNVVLRRLRDYIEVSWNSEVDAGAPTGFRFSEPPGAVLLRPEDVAQPLYDTAISVAQYLTGLGVESDRLRNALQRLEQIANFDQGDERMSWLVDVGVADRATAVEAVDADEQRRSQWAAIVDALKQDGAGAAFDAALEFESSPLVVTESSPASMLFASLSPTVSDEDVRTLSAVLLEQYAVGTQDDGLAAFARDVPLDPSVQAWEQGYELAEVLHEELGLDVGQGWIDVEAVLGRLGVQVVERTLADRNIRACSLVGPRHRPTVVHNRQSRYFSSRNARRFTMAHELCHLLFDRSHGRRVAMASGPWAPRAIERRANAFAAMFLMPSDLVESLIADSVEPLTDMEGIIRLAETLRLSRRAVLDHVYNLTLMGEAVRDDLWVRIRDTVVEGDGV